MVSVAKVAGGTLGFISGDVPGAVIGYNLAGKLTKKKMPAIKKKSKEDYKMAKVGGRKKSMVGPTSKSK